MFYHQSSGGKYAMHSQYGAEKQATNPSKVVPDFS